MGKQRDEPIIFELTPDKLQFVEQLARLFEAELQAARSGGLTEIAERRAIVGFVADRLIGALNRPRPAGSRS